MWLDYADEMIEHFEAKGEKLPPKEILDLVDKGIQDEMVKAFVKMEIKSKFVFGGKKSSSSWLLVKEIEKDFVWNRIPPENTCRFLKF